MKKFSRLTYDEFVMSGEVHEELPLHDEGLKYSYSLIENINNGMPVFEARIKDNALKVIHGAENLLVKKSNVGIHNNNIEFKGTADSYLELSNSLFASNNFCIEIKFKVTDFNSTVRSLFMLKNATAKSENELSAIINCKQRILYTDCYNASGIYSKPDYSTTAKSWSLSDYGAINENNWYTMRLVRYNNILITYINNILTAAKIIEGQHKCDYAYIGQKAGGTQSSSPMFDASQAFKGLIEYIKIYEIKDFPSTTTANLLCNTLKTNTFTTSFEVMSDSSYTNCTLLNAGTITANINSNMLTVIDGANTCSGTIEPNNKYIVFISHSPSNVFISIYNKTTNKAINQVAGVTVTTPTVSTISVSLNGKISHLNVYDYAMKHDRITSLSSRRLSMNQDGILDITLDEINGYRRLEIGNGVLSHLPLSDDYNSGATLYGTHKFIDGALKVGRYDEPILDRSENTRYCNLAVNDNWDKGLHTNAYLPIKWSYGYNLGVSNPSVGYHAKWVRDGYDATDLCLKFINCNEYLGGINRWLGSSTTIDNNEFWNQLNIGDKFTVSFKARSDIEAKIRLAFCKYISGAYQTCERKDVQIVDSNWKTYNLEFTFTEAFDKNFPLRLYIYGYFTNNATIWIQDVVLSKGTFKDSVDVLKDSKQREFNIALNDKYGLSYSRPWHVMYRTKILTANHIDTIAGIKIGYENGKFVVGSNSTSVDIRNEWLLYSIKHNNGKIYVKVYAKNKILSYTLTATTDLNLSFSNTGCGLYKDLNVVKDWYVEDNTVEKHFKLKMSYCKNDIMLSNVRVYETNNLKG